MKSKRIDSLSNINGCLSKPQKDGEGCETRGEFSAAPRAVGYVCIYRIEPVGEGESVRIYYERRVGDATERDCLTLLVGQYSKLGIRQGEIGEDEFSELLGAGELYSALCRGIGFLSYGDKSARMLKYKLERKGFSRDVATRAVGYLSENGYILEEDGALRRAELCAAKHWGPARIRQELRAQGYGEDAIDAAMESLEDYDFDASCREIVKKKCKCGYPADDVCEQKKLIASVMRYGYSYEQVKRAIAGELKNLSR